MMVLLVGVVARVTKDSVDGGHGGDGGRVTDSSSQQLLPDLPGEHARVVRLDADDSLHHAGRRHLLNKPAREQLSDIPLLREGCLQEFPFAIKYSLLWGCFEKKLHKESISQWIDTFKNK